METMITSKLTSKAQTTIPQPVRNALRLAAGDELAYEIDGGRVILTKASDRGAEDPFGAFSEMGQRRRSEGLCRALSKATSSACPFPIRIGQPASGVRFGRLQGRSRGRRAPHLGRDDHKRRERGLAGRRSFRRFLCKGRPSGAVPHSSLQTCDD